MIGSLAGCAVSNAGDNGNNGVSGGVVENGGTGGNDESGGIGDNGGVGGDGDGDIGDNGGVGGDGDGGGIGDNGGVGGDGDGGDIGGNGGTGGDGDGGAIDDNGGVGGGNETGDGNGTTDIPPVGSAVGYRFKDMTVALMDGSEINTADLRGKIVIINIWATWCSPCRAELPDFDRIATEYKDQVVIIAADTDAGMGSADLYVKQNFPTTDILFGYDSPYDDLYLAAGGYGYVPQTAILDQNGIIIYTDSGALSYEFLRQIIEANI